MVEFEREGFKLYRRPKHNKKERRRIGIKADDVRHIQVAAGFVRKRGTLQYIQRTAAITGSDFDATTGYLTLHTENGKTYRVKYKDVQHGEVGVN